MKSDLSLDQLGWSKFFSDQISEPLSQLSPARVTSAHAESWEVMGERGLVTAVPTGQLRFSGERWPAVGDWVLVHHNPGGELATIAHVLERRTVLARKAAGRRIEKQVIAANVDVVLVVTSFGPDFSPARIERYLSAIGAGGASPVLVLSKLDLSEHPQSTIGQAHALAGGAEALVTSVETGHGVDEVASYDRPGQTLVFVGSSGVGKSSLLNALLHKEAQPVQPIRTRDGTGRHTTTVRQMFALPGGGLVIDTPGLREFALWSSDEDPVPSAFSDINELALACRFMDCSHDGEPGCAVIAAIDRGELDARRLRSWSKLARELAYHAARQDSQGQLNRKRRWKSISKENRRRMKLLGR